MRKASAACLGVALLAVAMLPLLGCKDKHSLTLIPERVLQITTTSLPDAVEGVPYSCTVTATGGKPADYQWGASGLPNGLDIDLSTGEISGTPSSGASNNSPYTVTVTVTDGFQTATVNLSITVRAPLQITATNLPDAYDGQTGYSAQLTATGGTGTYTWSIVSGSLPPYLNFDSSGLISGDIASNASTKSPYGFTVQVADGVQTVQANLSIAVYVPLQITTTSLPNGYEGQTGYSVQLQATGGTGSYTWSVTGALPSNLNLAGDTIGGDIASGTAGFYQITVEVTDGIQTAAVNPTLTVHAQLQITTVGLPDAYDGQTGYSAQLTATGGAGTYTWSIVSGGPPPNLSLSGDTIGGDLAATASQGGTGGVYDITVQVTDGMQTVQADLSITVWPQLQITTMSLDEGYEGQTGYSMQLQATGGTGSYTWSITSGTLPSNLNWNAATATISGDIAAGTWGDYPLQFEVTDGIQTATANLTLTVYAQLQITTTSLRDAAEGIAYSCPVQATGGNPSNYNWSVSGQPAWLSIDATTGNLSGTPPAGSVGTYTFTVTVDDGLQSTSKMFDLTVKPSVWYVDAVSGSDFNGGTSWGDAFATIGKALSEATDSATIFVADATYNETNLNFNGKKVHLKGVDYHSGGLTRPVIDCQSSGRAFYFGSGETSDSVIDNFTIKNGKKDGASYPDNAGGAILCENSSRPSITNCTFSGNSAADRGGAIYCFSTINGPSITNCTFSGNSADDGGAIYYGNSGSPSITNCLFSGNSANSRGGAIFCVSSHPYITNCTFSGNSADDGGAIYCFSSSPSLNNCILWGNSASSSGNEIYVANTSSDCILYNCCVDNTGYGGITSNIGENNCIHDDPLFVDPGNGNYRLQATSPCIEKGSNNFVPAGVTTDLDGNPRIVDGDGNFVPIVDIGAYEYQP